MLELFEFCFVYCLRISGFDELKLICDFKKKETGLSFPSTNILFLSQVDKENKK